MHFDWSTSVFHSAMKHENDMSNVVGCFQVVRITKPMASNFLS